MKKLNLLIALLIIGLSAQGQMTKQQDNWKTVHKEKDVYEIQSVEFSTHTQYVMFFFNQKYKSIVDVQSIGFADLEELKVFFDACLDVTVNTEARYSDISTTIININKTSALIMKNKESAYFTLTQAQIKKAITQINTLEQD